MGFWTYFWRVVACAMACLVMSMACLVMYHGSQLVELRMQASLAWDSATPAPVKAEEPMTSDATAMVAL